MRFREVAKAVAAVVVISAAATPVLAQDGGRGESEQNEGGFDEWGLLGLLGLAGLIPRKRKDDHNR